MKLIALHGKDGIRGFCAVDDDDFEYVNQFRWKRTNSGYAARRGPRNGGEGKTYLMHRELCPGDHQHVDHINGDPLDNRRENLRPASASQNIANGKMRKNNTSGFKGVNRNGSGWSAKIKVNRKAIYLGTFRTPEEAGAAYEAAAKKHFGEFARTT